MNKEMLIAGGAVGLGVLLLLNKKPKGTSDAVSGIADPTYNNGTLYIPTNQYDVHAYYGDVSNVDNRNYGSQEETTPIQGGPVASSPIQQPTGDPNVVEQNGKKYVKTPTETSIFPARDLGSDGSFTTKLVELVSSDGTGWYVVKTWKGNRWIKPGLKVAYGMLPTGQSPKAPAKATTPTTTQPTHAVSYTIQKGDTLSGIAAKYHTTIAVLEKLNGITNPNLIYAGTTIKISV